VKLLLQLNTPNWIFSEITQDKPAEKKADSADAGGLL